MTITPLPTPPSSTTPSTFNAQADAFFAALPQFVTEVNAIGTPGLGGGTMLAALGFVAGTVSLPGLFAAGDTDTGLWAPAANTLALSCGATEIVRFTSTYEKISGLLGIGMTPTNILDITQTQNNPSAVSLTNANTGVSAFSKFQLTNSANSALFGLSSTGYSGAVYPGGPSGQQIVIGTGANIPIVFALNNAFVSQFAYVGGTPILYIDNNGGTFNQGHLIQGGSASQMYTAHPSGTGGGTLYASYYYNAAAIGSISQNSTTGVLFNTTSDMYLKRNKGVATSIKTLNGLVVHEFDWISTGDADIGLFAQEAFVLKPSAVRKGGDNPHTDPWSVDYSKFVPDLIVGWQNHESRLSVLELKAA